MESSSAAAPPEDALAFERQELAGGIGERFERVVRRFPERAAVREAGSITTYAELDAAANRFARSFAAELSPERPIALMGEPGARLFAAMLGALKAGRFYVPLDPRLPRARLEAIWSDLEGAELVADETWLELARDLAGDEGQVRRAAAIDTAPDADAALPGTALAAAPDALAYVLFTSGSTGRPKGVMQSHRNVLHNVRKLTSGLGIRADDRVTLLYSVSVGASVSDIFGALLNGAAVCPHSLAGDGLRRLPEFLTRERITIYHSVPSAFRSLSATLDGREDLSCLRVVKLGGEPVLASDFDLYRNRFPRSCLFHVGFGATEMNVIRQWFGNHETPWPGGTPLGYAVEETEIVLLDEQGRETPTEGEIGVRARTLPLGYWKDPDLTAATFLPVTGHPGVRLYRTGDLGRLLPDGCLLHVGRRDDRLKVRGHRVETSAVEAALLTVPGVREAAVAGRDGPEGTRLVAWIARDAPHPPGIAQLRRALSDRLSQAMIPSAFVFLDALPRTPSGKVDRLRLPPPRTERPPLSTPFVETRDPSEAAAATAFRDALGVDSVGADDDFFELGGDSLSAVDVLASLSRVFDVELSVADLLEAPTPAGLAARARRSEEAGTPSSPDLVRLQNGDRRPVFVVPGGAGDREDLFAARRIARATGGGFPFLCFRSGPPPHPPVERLSERFLRALRAASPRGPYAVVGDCVGGAVALTMARQLRAQGETVCLLALLDSPFPTTNRRLRAWLFRRAPRVLRVAQRLSYFRERLAYHLGVLSKLPRGRLAYAARIGRVASRGLAAPDDGRRRQFLAQRASYVGAALARRPQTYDGRVLIVESAESRARGYSAAWRRVTPSSQIVCVPGGHAGFLLDHSDLVGEALRRALEEEEEKKEETKKV